VVRYSAGVIGVLTLIVCVQAAGAARSARAQFGIVAFDLNGPAPLRLRQLGVGLIRGACPWRDLEPSRGRFNWTCSDNLIFGARKIAARSYVTVECAPDWTHARPGCGEMPADIEDWYAFVAQYVARYRGFNTILGIWNEPNLTLAGSHADYALLFINASSARNAVDSTFVLAGPDTSHHALASGYFAQAIDTIQIYHALDPQDIVAVHWYGDGPPLLDYLEAVNKIVGGRDVWLSETGYNAADAAAQTAFYGRMLTTFLDSAPPWWTHVVFYRLWDGRDCCEAVLRADYTPTPAFDAYRRSIAEAADNPDTPARSHGSGKSGE
jgi:Glycosyl hydrolase catalytic core